MAAVACRGLLAMDAHVRGDFKRLTGLWKVRLRRVLRLPLYACILDPDQSTHHQTTHPQALVQLAMAHKDSLSPSSFDAAAALTRLLEYAEQGAAGMERAAGQSQQQQQQQQQQQGARAFEQVGRCELNCVIGATKSALAPISQHQSNPPPKPIRPASSWPSSSSASPYSARTLAPAPSSPPGALPFFIIIRHAAPRPPPRPPPGAARPGPLPLGNPAPAPAAAAPARRRAQDAGGRGRQGESPTKSTLDHVSIIIHSILSPPPPLSKLTD